VLFLSVTLLSWPASAQEGSAEPSSRLEVKAGSLNPAAVRFSPPPPPKPAPDVVAEASSEIRKGTHSITLVRGEPSTLPDIPEPPERVATAEVPFLLPGRPNFLLGLQITVYRIDDRDLSYLRWTDPQTKEKLEAWCGWDWRIVSPMREISNDRVAYNLFFSAGYVDTSKRDPLGRWPVVPNPPAVAADDFVITKGDASSPSGKEFLEAVQRYCVANRADLERMRDAREQYRADAEAWKKANPWKPRDYTIVLRPHRGSRYLEGRVPAVTTPETSTEEAGQ